MCHARADADLDQNLKVISTSVSENQSSLVSLISPIIPPACQPVESEGLEPVGQSKAASYKLYTLIIRTVT